MKNLYPSILWTLVHAVDERDYVTLGIFAVSMTASGFLTGFIIGSF